MCTDDLNKVQNQLNNMENTDDIMIELPQEHKVLSFKMNWKVHKTFIQISMKTMTCLVILEYLLQLHQIAATNIT